MKSEAAEAWVQAIRKLAQGDSLELDANIRPLPVELALEEHVPGPWESVLGPINVEVARIKTQLFTELPHRALLETLLRLGAATRLLPSTRSLKDQKLVALPEHYACARLFCIADE